MAKQTVTKISGLEKLLLKEHAKSSPLLLVRYKAQAILMDMKGMAAEDIGDLLDRKAYTVNQWLRDWRQRRLSSIFTGHADNSNASKLTHEQLEEVKQTLKQPPSETGLPKEFWDVPQLKQYVKTTFDRKRDEVFITERMKAITAERAPLLSDDACDEVRMDQEAVIRKAWLQKGERTIVKVNRKKESQSYIGFLNQKSFDCELFEMS